MYLFFDYVDPLSYLLDRALVEIEDVGDLSVRREPFEIRPPPAAMLDPDEKSWRDRWESAIRMETAGSPLIRPRIVPWTRKAHELALHAREHGCFRDVHDALFRVYLQEGKDIGRIDVLLEIGVSCGLDHLETKAVLDVDRYAEAVEAATSSALARGVTEVPCLRLGERALTGYPGEEALRAFLAGGSQK